MLPNDTRNPAYPKSSWDDCVHVWIEKADSQHANNRFTEVKCIHCGCPGEQDRITGGTFWPAT